MPNNAYDLNVSSTNDLYFPSTDSIKDPNRNFIVWAYWLVSISAHNEDQLISLDCVRGLYNDKYDSYCLAVRPAVYIPVNIKGFYNTEDDIWEIE